jgi:death-on-curing protein
MGLSLCSHDVQAGGESNARRVRSPAEPRGPPFARAAFERGRPRGSGPQRDLHGTLIEKAAALCFSLAQNHFLVDGNKRVAHAAMETFLVLNGSELNSSVDAAPRRTHRRARGPVSSPTASPTTRRSAAPRPTGCASKARSHGCSSVCPRAIARSCVRASASRTARSARSSRSRTGLGLSRERVRQLEKRALDRLLLAASEASLDDWMHR